LFDAVQHGDLDAAVCLHPQFSLPKTLVWQQLREEKLIAIVPLEMADHEPHELFKTMPFIRFDRKQWGGQQVDLYLQKANIIPRERVEISHLSAIATLVGRGLGVALVPDTVMPLSATSRVARLPLPLETKPRQLGILWQRSSIHGKLIDIFVNQAKILCETNNVD
jgi:DNA-binding transcriptional LysR family regulator